MAVKIDNHPQARPHAGLNQADVVIEEIVEGITRFFAVFHSTDAAPLGPIRSARTTDVDLLNQLNKPLFVWSGGNRGVVNAISRANAISIAHGQGPGYYRDQERRRRADLEHTLNYLTLPDVPLRVSGPDQLEIDAFYRYNETIQRFFNGAAGIATRYERVAS